MRTVKYTNEKDFQCLEDLKETSAELTLIHMGRENCLPYHVFSGTRNEYILHFVTAGHGFYSACGNTWSLDAGKVFLIQPDQPVVYCSDSLDPWSYFWVGFKGSRVERMLRKCGFTRNTLYLSLPNMNDFLQCFNDLLSHVSLDYSDSLYRESVLMKIISLLCLIHSRMSAKDNSDPAKPADSNPYVAQAVEFITFNYMHDISVSAISRRIGISGTHLNRLFQKEYSMSVQNFLMEYRMHKAASLLSGTDLPVKLIAVQTGYNDALVFSKAFKSRYGVSPKNYRIHEEELELRRQRPSS